MVWIQCSCMRFSSKINLGAEDRTQQLSALSALAEDGGSVPSTQGGAYNQLSLPFQGILCPGH